MQEWGRFIRPGDLPAQREKLLGFGPGKSGDLRQSNLCNKRGEALVSPNWGAEVGMRNVSTGLNGHRYRIPACFT